MINLMNPMGKNSLMLIISYASHLMEHIDTFPLVSTWFRNSLSFPSIWILSKFLMYHWWSRFSLCVPRDKEKYKPCINCSKIVLSPVTAKLVPHWWTCKHASWQDCLNKSQLATSILNYLDGVNGWSWRAVA